MCFVRNVSTIMISFVNGNVMDEELMDKQNITSMSRNKGLDLNDEVLHKDIIPLPHQKW